MNREQIVVYIKNCQSRGYSLEDAIQKLRQKSIPEEIIQEALDFEKTLSSAPAKSKKKYKKIIISVSLIFVSFLLAYLGYGRFLITKTMLVYEDDTTLSHYFLGSFFAPLYSRQDRGFYHDRNPNLKPHADIDFIHQELQKNSTEKIYIEDFNYKKGGVTSLRYLFSPPRAFKDTLLLNNSKPIRYNEDYSYASCKAIGRIEEGKGFISELAGRPFFVESCEDDIRYEEEYDWEKVFKQVKTLMAKYPVIDSIQFKSFAGYKSLKINGSHEIWVGRNGNILKRIETSDEYEVTMDPDGNLLQEVEITDGRPDGLTKIWYPNGKLRSEMNFHQGNLHGAAKRWSEDGVLESEDHFEEGVLSGKSTYWDKYGNMEMEGNYKNGKLDGLVFWYEGPAPDTVVHYVQGKKEGESFTTKNNSLFYARFHDNKIIDVYSKKNGQKIPIEGIEDDFLVHIERLESHFLNE